jgi:hypothetical protein
VLVDFGGVCHGWRPEQSGGSTVTGTFGYMPPEQLMGRVSPQSDLYALGATLLYAVTGREPTDFDFDGGRLSVPESIDLRPSLRRAIDAMLAPAPRDRPRTARAVRAVLLGSAGEAPPAPSHALVVARRADMTMLGGHDAPLWIDLGSPPRDPAGDLADVYQTLVEPLDMMQGASQLAKAAAWSLYTLVSVVSLGIVPAIYYGHVRNRKRRYEPLFRRGVQTEGTIVSIQGSEEYNLFATIGYEYKVGGETFRAFIDCRVKLKRYWSIGDRVAVLHDPDAPARSCIAFRRG